MKVSWRDDRLIIRGTGSLKDCIFRNSLDGNSNPSSSSKKRPTKSYVVKNRPAPYSSVNNYYYSPAVSTAVVEQTAQPESTWKLVGLSGRPTKCVYTKRYGVYSVMKVSGSG